MTSIIGNIDAQRSPIFKLLSNAPDTCPTIIGPNMPPKSPASAKKANMAVPPFGHFCDEILIDPGHITPTVKPHKEQPTSPKMDKGESDANK